MSARKNDGPRNSLGRPWTEGEAWRCARCGKTGPDRDDVALGLCLPREGAHSSLAYHDLDFEPASHAEAMAAKRARRTPVDFGAEP